MISSRREIHVWNPGLRNWFLWKSIQSRAGQIALLYYKVRDRTSLWLHCRDLSIPSQLKCSTCSHHFNIHPWAYLLLAEEFYKQFNKMLHSDQQNLRHLGSTLIVWTHTLDKLRSETRNGLQGSTQISEKVMLVVNRNMKTLSDQAESPFCLR